MPGIIGWPERLTGLFADGFCIPYPGWLSTDVERGAGCRGVLPGGGGKRRRPRRAGGDAMGVGCCRLYIS